MYNNRHHYGTSFNILSISFLKSLNWNCVEICNGRTINQVSFKDIAILLLAHSNKTLWIQGKRKDKDNDSG